jgi:hypothetical protein
MKKLTTFLCLTVFCTSIVAQFETALEFDGFGSHVIVDHHSGLSMTSFLTIEVRVWAEEYDPGGWQEFVFKGGNSPVGEDDPREYYIRPQNGNGRAQFQIQSVDGEEYSVKSDSTLTPGVCYHLAGTYDGNFMRIYVNGVLEDTDDIGPITIAQGDGPLAFAQLGSVFAEHFDGQISEVRIWNTARTADDICTYVNDTLPASIYSDPTSGLVGYWRLDEGDGNMALDLSVYQAHGLHEGDPQYAESCQSSSCPPLEIEEHAAEIFIAPNPVSDQVYISSEERIEVIYLTELDGRTIHYEAIGAYYSKLDVGHFVPGVYMVHFITDSGVSAQRLVIQH